MSDQVIALAGATGKLGERIAKALVKRKVKVRALVRSGSDPKKIAELKKLGIELREIDFNSSKGLIEALQGVTCVVSALSGLRPVIVGTQSQLLEAAIKAKVPRFIPSDYSIDYTKLPEGSNRNLDVRREFNLILDQASIRATSVLNGAFADMLTGQAPIVLFKLKRILYWGRADQKMDFTTIDDAADFTAAAALDEQSPRYLRIAGDQLSPRDLAMQMTEISGTKFRLFYAGELFILGALIKLTKKMMPPSEELYPPWQGMQYLHNMYSGLAKFKKLDNDRYYEKKWTTARDVLLNYQRQNPQNTSNT